MKEDLFCYWYMHHNRKLKPYGTYFEMCNYRDLFIPKLFCEFAQTWREFIQWIYNNVNSSTLDMEYNYGSWTSVCYFYDESKDDKIKNTKYIITVIGERIIAKNSSTRETFITPAYYGIMRKECITNTVISIPFMVTIQEGRFDSKGRLHGDGLMIIHYKNEPYQKCVENGIVIRGSFNQGEPFGRMEVKWANGTHYKGELHLIRYGIPRSEIPFGRPFFVFPKERTIRKIKSF
jgi:hypothetical protein